MELPVQHGQRPDPMQVGGQSNTGITVGVKTLIGPCVSSCEAVSLFRTSDTKAVAF